MGHAQEECSLIYFTNLAKIWGFGFSGVQTLI